MRHPLFYSAACIVLSGCIIDIYGGKWPIDLGDTGMVEDLEDDTGVENSEYDITPDHLAPGALETLTVTSETIEEWTNIRSVTAIGDLQVLDFKASEGALLVSVTVPDAAMDGPAHLIFEFSDGDVQMVREAIYIEAVEEEVPADTGLVEDEPTND